MDRTYSVPGISCDHCRQAIASEVTKVIGVEDVDVNVAERTVTVRGEAAEDAVRTAIDEAGYEVAGVA